MRAAGSLHNSIFVRKLFVILLKQKGFFLSEGLYCSLDITGEFYVIEIQSMLKFLFIYYTYAASKGTHFFSCFVFCNVGTYAGKCNLIVDMPNHIYLFY